MNDVAVTEGRLFATSEAVIAQIRNYENRVIDEPQVAIKTWHVLHAGIYTRTIIIPALVKLTGALVKVATTLIVSGNVIISINDTFRELSGYHVLAASANRKQAFFAKTDTYLTMFFATDAKTVEEAEAQFTDDVDLLLSRKPDAENQFLVTGE